MTVLAALLIAVLSPVLGAIADAGGRRKPWLLAFMLHERAATAALWFVAPEHELLLLALTLVWSPTSATRSAQAFYNAMLPDLASHDQLGRWSGWGWGLGYIAGIVASLILLFGVRPAANRRCSGWTPSHGRAGADHRAAAGDLVRPVLAAAVPDHARTSRRMRGRSPRACARA